MELTENKYYVLHYGFSSVYTGESLRYNGLKAGAFSVILVTIL